MAVDSALRMAGMLAWIGEEQQILWSDLKDAIDRAANGTWSIEASNIARRIVGAARLVGPTERGALPYGLDAGGVYRAVYAAGGIEIREPAEAEWARWDGMMAKHGTTRETARPRYAKTVAAISEDHEMRWIAGDGGPTQ